jgi:membrane-bound ClpP family serine protease
LRGAAFGLLPSTLSGPQESVARALKSRVRLCYTSNMVTEEQWQKIIEWISDPIVILILAFIGTNILLKLFKSLLNKK